MQYRVVSVGAVGGNQNVNYPLQSRSYIVTI